MNQTQIAYFERKIETALRSAKRSIDDSVVSEEMTTGQKVAQIMTGKARFKVEAFAGADCPYDAEKLFRFFEFEGADEIKSRNAAAVVAAEKKRREAEREAGKLLDAFVLEKLADPVAAIDDFIGKYEEQPKAQPVLVTKKKKR